MSILAVLAPLALLALILAALVVVQAGLMWNASRESMRRRGNQRIAQGFARDVALAQSMLARRSQELEGATRRLRHGNEELSRLNNMKNKFLAMAVHDVRNPLAAVRGYAELLLRRRGQGSDVPMLKAIVRSTNQVNQLISDLTDLALIEAGKMKIEKAVFPVSEMIADVAAPVAFIAEKRGVRFPTPEVQAGMTLNADKGRLGRVLSNLLGNAVKFTPSGGAVELRARVEGGAAAFYVKDTGPGIHPDERAKIFQKFYQSKHLKDAAARSAGWGLGLAIAEEIVRGHNGKIGVESPGLGRGATFWFRVPGVRVSAALALMLASSCAVVRAQNLPLEDKERFERSLAKRAQDVMREVVGPNRTRVIVDATLDFTRIERFDISAETATASSAGKIGDYLWKSAIPQDATQPELLPGIPLPGGPDTSKTAAVGPRSYEKSDLFPSDFVKKLSVTLILNDQIEQSRVEELRKLAASVLGLNPGRGDTLTIARAHFEPVWKAVWSQPETAEHAVEYLLLGIFALLALLIASVSLMRVTTAMREIAHAQSQQISMEMSGPDKSNKPDGSTDPELLGLEGGESSAGSRTPVPVQESVNFPVRPDQIEAVAVMLQSERPENIALIAAHLDGEIRTAVLHRLPEDVAVQTTAAMAHVRFVDPDMIEQLRSEFERRLTGAIGGLDQAARMLECQAMNERSRLLRGIARIDSQLARELQRRSPTYDTLLDFNEQQWSEFATRLTTADWGCLLTELPEPARESLRKVLSAPAWKLIEQIAETSCPAAQKRATEVKFESALRELMSAVTTEIQEGSTTALEVK